MLDIDRVVKHLESMADSETYKSQADEYRQIVEWLKEFKEIKELNKSRKIGDWVRYENPRYEYDREHGDSFAGVSFICSSCGHNNSILTPKFCPECGARMLNSGKV